MPLSFIEGDLTERVYPQFYEKFTQTFKDSKYISAIIIGTTRVFGYAIYENDTMQRSVLGTENFLTKNEGDVQIEETLISKKSDQSDIVSFEGKDIPLYRVGIKVTIDVLNNYCGQNFMMDGLVFKVYDVAPDLKKIYPR